MKTLESLVRRFVEGHPQDAAKAFEELDAAEASKIICWRLCHLNKLPLCSNIWMWINVSKHLRLFLIPGPVSCSNTYYPQST